MTDKLELKSIHEVIYTVNIADVDSIFQGKPTDPDILTVVMKNGEKLYCDEVCPIDSMQEEPISEDLEKAIGQSFIYHENHGDDFRSDKQIETAYRCGFRDGAKWQKEHLWKPADGNDLPEIDREVIALFDNDKVGYIGYAHRPPEYWDGKNIDTDKVTRYYPKRYDGGGWNAPDVKWWLDVKLPQEFET
jgi:hypothetical protein